MAQRDLLLTCSCCEMQPAAMHSGNGGAPLHRFTVMTYNVLADNLVSHPTRPTVHLQPAPSQITS